MSFSKAELAGLVDAAWAVFGDVVDETVVLLDVLAGAYDLNSLEVVGGASVSLPVGALVARYRSSELVPDTVLATDRKVCLRQRDVPGIVPSTRDRLSMSGATWHVLDVHQDTGASVWVLQVRRASEAEEEW